MNHLAHVFHAKVITPFGYQTKNPLREERIMSVVATGAIHAVMGLLGGRISQAKVSYAKDCTSRVVYLLLSLSHPLSNYTFILFNLISMG